MEEVFSTASLPVYAYRNAALHGFCLSLYVRAGSMYESAEENGVSHCLEHMVFRNVNRSMNGGLYQFLDRCGLSFNAVTYKELVQFYIVGATEHFDDAVTVFSHIFDPMDLPRSEIEPEIRRIKSEIREADEFTCLDYFADGCVWEDTSLARSILGPVGNLNRMGSRFLADAARRMFSGNNMFFYVTGNVPDSALSRFCSSVPALESTVSLRDNNAPLPRSFCRRPRRIFLKNSDETVVRFSFDFDPARYSHAELMLLYDILFYGECGKVFRELSERTGLIYSFDSSIERFRNGGVIHLKYEVRQNDLYRSVELVRDLLNRLKQGITDELETVRPLYLDNGDLMLDSAEDLNWNRAYEVHFLDCPYPTHEARKQAFASVQPQRIAQIAREIFRRDHLTFAMKGNRRRVDCGLLESVLSELG